MKLERYDAYVLGPRRVLVHINYPSSKKPQGTQYLLWVHNSIKPSGGVRISKRDGFVYRNCGMSL
jgi:hypothetical protein